MTQPTLPVFSWRRRAGRTALFTALCLATLAAGRAQAGDGTANGGFLYGHVFTGEGGEYEGFLRWGRQEAFWDDLFHSMKTELPAREAVDPELIDASNPSHGGKVEVLGMRIRWSTKQGDARRMFIARFGDIASIEPGGRDEARVEMRDGEIYDVSGYSDDVRTRVRLVEANGNERQIGWKQIDRIDFFAAPERAQALAGRLWGTVETRHATWTGFVTWDKEECLTTDLLDADSRDGEVSVAMGKIHRIERRGSTRCLVELNDGTRMKLWGSQDVDNHNRGIMIEVENLGRVTVPWDRFESFERSDHAGSGRAYGEYGAGRALAGRIETTGGEVHRGRLVFDLDEARSWEMLNGAMGETLFDLPLANVTSIEPLDEQTCLVMMRDGSELELGGGQDLTSRNEGLLVFPAETGDPVYVPWSKVQRVEFEP